MIKISVRNIIEFSLASGDLASGFVSNARAVEGIKGHIKVQSMRPDSYEAEVPISYVFQEDEIEIEIHGRIDGVFSNPPVIEEIKTTTSDLECLQENILHWAQAKMYAFIYAKQNKLDAIDIQLTYFHIETKALKEVRKTLSFQELCDFFVFVTTKYFKWIKKQHKWIKKRDDSLKKLSFPFSDYREGQRKLALCVYWTIHRGENVFIQAPTGIGKSMGVIFPALKNLGEGHIERIFFLTAKTLGRTAAEQAFLILKEHGLRIKTVTLTAKDKICFQETPGCDVDNCEFAKGYFDILPDALDDIFSHDIITRSLIEKFARKHMLCPFEFSLDIALTCDVIIGDYNYAFDPAVSLKRFFIHTKEKYAFLIDEAHNLVDRARAMFSAELFKKDVLEMKRATKGLFPEIHKNLTQINKFFIEARKHCEKEKIRFYTKEEKPKELLTLLRKYIKISDTLLMKRNTFHFRETFLQLYFTVNAFCRISEVYEEKHITYIEKSSRDIKIKLYCQDPSSLLEKVLKKIASVIFFSATMTPMHYYQQILTNTLLTPVLELPSPFPEENSCHIIINNIATTYKQRDNTYDEVAYVIEKVIMGKRGNYLIYFPSYKYLEEVFDRFSHVCSDMYVVTQQKNMSEDEREAFLDIFSHDNDRTVVGFVVMGGIFGEGIDLVGERLIGAVIVGVGLPQICLERDILRNHFCEKGFQYAYLYPAINRVLQACGRVIRSETDRGVIALIDERFTTSQYSTVLPHNWKHAHIVRHHSHLERILESFWKT